MSVIPSVKVSASATLQRSYFTSELFVTSARADIESLLSTFEHLAEDEAEPFAIFKRTWVKEGWNHAHLFVWEDTSRDEYFHTMFRLFLERIQKDEEESIQVGAVFGLFTLFKMQSASAHLYYVKQIPITIDTLEHLASLVRSTSEPHQPYILYILSQLLSESYLCVLPSSTLKPQRPAILPNSSIVRNEGGLPPKQTGKGGKTKTELDRAGRRKWQMLGTWVDERASAGAGGGELIGNREEYEATKVAAVESMPDEVEVSAERNALARLKALPTEQTGPSEGIDRFEKMLEKGAHILRNQWEMSNRNGTTLGHPNPTDSAAYISHPHLSLPSFRGSG